MFSGAAFIGFSSGDWQSDNIDDELRAAPRSINSPNAIKHIHMFTGSLGGPIKRDKMWFLVTARHQSSDEIDHRRARADHRAGRRGHQLLSRHLRARAVAASDVAGGAEAQARDLRAALVEAQGQGLRRRTGSARVAVPRPEARASHGRQHPLDVAADQQAALRGRLFVDAVRLARRADAGRRTAARLAAVVRRRRRKTDTQRQVDRRVRVHGANSAVAGLHDVGIELRFSGRTTRVTCSTA